MSENQAFNPAEHLSPARKNGPADYLAVKWRLVWLRAEHPAATIETEKVAGGMESNYAEFKARVSIPEGGSATGYGSESKADFGDFIEKAETKAIGRALAALGYGTQFVGAELDEGLRIVDSPTERPASRRPAPQLIAPAPRPTPAVRPQAPRNTTKQATPAAPLTEGQERAWAAIYDMASNNPKVSYGAIREDAFKLHAAATPGQWATVCDRMKRLQQEFYPDTVTAIERQEG